MDGTNHTEGMTMATTRRLLLKLAEAARQNQFLAGTCAERHHWSEASLYIESAALVTLASPGGDLMGAAFHIDQAVTCAACA